MLLLALWAGALHLQNRASSPPGRGRASDVVESIFDLNRVWNLHLNFTADQWKAMEPQGGSGPMGGPGGPGGPGGRGGRGGFGGRSGFGPAMFLAPLFLSQGDANKDGRLSRDEFLSLGRKWFKTWDTNGAGRLDAGQLRTGLNATIAASAGAGLGGWGGPGAPGGPGGDGRGGGPGFVGSEGRRNGMAAASGIDYAYAKADLEFEGQTLPDVAVRYKGNNTFMMSRNSLKRPLKVDLNRSAPGRKLGGATKFNLHNNINDGSWMNEALSYRLFRDAGVPAPRTSYARLCVTVPGQYDRKYLGLYSVIENVDNTFARHNFGTKKGAIFKPVGRGLFEYQGDDWAAYRQPYDPKTPVSAEETERFIAFCRLVSKASDEDFATQVADFLDLDEFARFMAVTTWLCTLDSILMMGQNYLVYLHPKTHRFQFIPWDLDHSFGQFPMAGSQEQLETLNILKPWTGQHLFLERVFKVQAFHQLYLDHMKEFSQTIFQPQRIARQVDDLGGILRPAVLEESDEKLARFDKLVAGQPVEGMGFGGRDGPGGGRRGWRGQRGDAGDTQATPADGPRSSRAGDDASEGPRMMGPPGGFGARKPIKGFVVARAQSVNDQLAGKTQGATLNQFGPGGGPGGRGGRGGFEPGMFIGPVLTTAFDTDKDGAISESEFSGGFEKWFQNWNTDASGLLSEAQLRAGIDKDLGLQPGRMRGGFGPPPGDFEPPDGPGAH